MKKLLAVLTLLVMVFALGCAKAPAEPINIAALKGPTGMGISYMMDDTKKYNVELQDAPDVVVGKFVSGEIDIAAVPINLAATLYNKTEGNVVLLNLDTLGVLYIVENGDSIKSLSDLAGKTIYASGEGATPQFVLDYLLAQNGLTDQVTVKYVGEHTALAAMVASGEAQIAILPNRLSPPLWSRIRTCAWRSTSTKHGKQPPAQSSSWAFISQTASTITRIPIRLSRS